MHLTRRQTVSPVTDSPTLLLLSPARGELGGIERITAAVCAVWPGTVRRVDFRRLRGGEVEQSRFTTKARFLARALAEARTHRSDVVLAVHVGLVPIAHMVGRCARSRVAVIGHGDEVWGEMSAARQRGLRMCDHVLAVSSFTADWMARRAGIPRGRIRVVAPPVAAPFEEALIHRGRDIVHRPPHLLTVARIAKDDHYKGHRDVVAALPLILASRSDARWIVVGSGDDRTALEAECAERGVDGAVTFHGFVDDAELVTLYEQSSAMVLPSIADPEAVPPTGEGFGLVYAEAACLGVPSIAARRGGGSLDFVEDGRTGLCVGAGDPEELAEAALRLLDDRVLRARLGEAARERVRDRHLRTRFAEALVDALL